MLRCKGLKVSLQTVRPRAQPRCRKENVLIKSVIFSAECGTSSNTLLERSANLVVAALPILTGNSCFFFL